MGCRSVSSPELLLSPLQATPRMASRNSRIQIALHTASSVASLFRNDAIPASCEESEVETEMDEHLRRTREENLELRNTINKQSESVSDLQKQLDEAKSQIQRLQALKKKN